VRQRVLGLLDRSEAYRALPPDKRRQVAHNTARVASYLVDPARLVSQEFARPLLAPNELLHAVDFPSFVGGLIDGVFGAIVNASIQQMEAYAELVKHAAKSVSSFEADSITDSSARTVLLTRFPHLLCASPNGRLRLAQGLTLGRSDRAYLSRSLGLRRTWPATGSTAALRGLVTAVRRRTARERQKAFALVLAMGINRIVATRGVVRPTGRQRTHLD
jgi:hypothetical protein